jgi:acyl-CoA reductase-like NAD-dependent aldehyde dehydrogenase/4-aminobutyrate aminotransferase-like enzyme
MGKLKSEALTEAKGLSARIDLMINHGVKRVQTEPLYDLRAETRYHNQGVLVVIGPYNFPAHLMNSHIIPSVMLGNTVIIKPSEVCPWVGEIYARCVMEAEFAPGVINIVQGDGAIGKALSEDPGIDGVLFTGSYRTGRLLQESLLDQPHKILALEMGGKNFSVVMDDADLGQALIEIIQAAFLTTGQRCTATSRVLVHDRVFEKFRVMLIDAVKQLRPSMPSESGLFGPMATKGALDNFLRGLAQAKTEGAKILVESEVLGGGAFVTPSLYQVAHDHPLKHYLGEELFGPNIALENFSHLDDAVARINESPYGLSNAIFTFNQRNSEQMLRETKSGVFNINRSTNNAYGQMPFGGVNKSGNQRAAGIDAVRYATFPMAITSLPYGANSAPKSLQTQFRDFLVDETPRAIITMRHAIETTFETYGVYSDVAAGTRLSFSRASFSGLGNHHDAFFRDLVTIFGDAIDLCEDHFVIDVARAAELTRILDALADCLQRYAGMTSLLLTKVQGLAINVPHNLELPRSRAMLDRLYKNQFFPAEKKLLVADLKRSRGPFLVSVDDDPLVLFDAASQIATLGAGFAADAFQNAYDCNDFDRALLRNCDLSLPDQNENCATYQDAKKARAEFEAFLAKKTENKFSFIGYGASGAEANEIAFDLARMNGPGGTRILAFEGSFHGRTIMALQATYNKEKRGPFAFAGYEATFVPFPETKHPHVQPEIPRTLLLSLSRGEIPTATNDDPLFAAEIAALTMLKEEIAKGNICAVIIEPMQCEGGDRYATDRFFSSLRALTRALRVPLIFDEVQTGFHLGRKFFWYQSINLIDQDGKPELPDCVTLAKKAQLGVCMSVWSSARIYTPHVIQLKRGLLHAKVLDQADTSVVEAKAMKELVRLQEYFPELIENPRASGFAFAFDMPTKALANELVDQRFHRGFMAYIAGERTLRFRLNTVSNDDVINRLFEKLFLALVDMRDHTTTKTAAASAPIEPPKIAIHDIRIHEITAEHFARFAHSIERIEIDTYEIGRRDDSASLLSWLNAQDSLGLIMTCTVDNQEIVAGYAFGGPLEYAKVEGATSDAMHGKHNTFYSANITIAKHLRGFGLGGMLKSEQIKRVALIKNRFGEPRYHFMSGRNRVGATPAMNQINDNLGAYLVSRHDNQYNEKGASAVYYRLPLELGTHCVELPSPSSLDCHNSVQRVFKMPPTSLVNALRRNHVRAIAGSKLTLSNWATPHVIRYTELLRALMPKHLHHAYFTSGRDEILDKGLRCLRYHRADADSAVGFSHQWFGHNTAAARSLSHDDNQAQPFAFFKWPKITHPSLCGNAASLNAINQAITEHGADKILGIVVELVGERSGFTVDNGMLQELDTLRAKTGVPLVFVENASSLQRTGRGVFLSDQLSVKANMVLWYTGGQLGHVFVDDKYYTDKPLTLISTWDGDEISVARAYHHLSTCADLDAERILQFEQAIKAITPKDAHHGLGLWNAVRLKNDATLSSAQSYARDRGVYFGAGFDSSLMICPKADFTDEEFARILHVVEDIISQMR